MRAWVLSGGGVLGAYQIAVMRQVLERNLTRLPELVVGSSVGALNGFALSVLGLDRATDLWLKKVEGHGSVATFNGVVPIWGGVYNLTPLYRMLQIACKPGDGFQRRFVCGAVNSSSGQIEYFDSNKIGHRTMIEHVLGSASIPVYFEPWRGYYDCGVVDVTPLREAIRLGAEHVDVFLCQPVYSPLQTPWSPGFPKWLHHGLRAFEIIRKEIFANDLQVCQQKNTQDGYRRVSVNVYAPLAPLPYTITDFSKKTVRALYHEGTVFNSNLLQLLEIR